MCPATCYIPAAETQQALVADVLAWDPSNTTIQEWLNNYPDSNATTLQSELAVALLQTGMYNLTPTELATYDADLASINPELPYLYTNAGIVTDPNYVAFANDPSVGFDPVYGGYNPNLVAGDLLTLMTNNETNWSALSNINTLWFLADPVPAAAAATDQSSSAATDLSTALGAFDPATWSADLSQMLAGLGTTTGSDLLSQLISELGTQLATDFGTQLPSSLLSMF
jgi:hypothetical protein